MEFIVIEIHGGADCAAIITDTAGNNKVFDTQAEAEAEAADCQEGIVIAI